MSTRGAKVKVHLRSGDVVEGWVYAETRLGFYVATDRTGNVIRYIPDGTWQSASYDSSDSVQFSSAVDDIYRSRQSYQNTNEALKREITRALSRVDYNRIRRIHGEFETLQSYFDGSYGTMLLWPRIQDDRARSLLEIALRLRANYAELIDETDRSGLSNILLENADQIQQLVSMRGLPDFDYFMVREERLRLLEEMVYLAQQRNLIAETDLGKNQLREISVEIIAKHIDDEEVETKEEGTEQETSRWPKRLKKTAALGKIAVGGGLAAANVAAGIFAGVVSALPTLGIGTVAGAVGVATSVYTGLNASCDGLKDFAAALESK